MLRTDGEGPRLGDGAERRLRLALAGGHIGIWEWNVATGAVYWSPECHAILGVPPDAFGSTRDDFLALVLPEDRPALWRRVEAALAGGPPYDGEFRIRRPDGAVRWVVNRGEVERGADGAPLRLVGIVGDVTERHHTMATLAAREQELRATLAAVREREEALREKQERLQAALDASDTGTFRWDIVTNALHWDENLDRLFGLERRQSARSLPAFLALVHPADRAAVRELCARCASEGVDFAMEFRVVWPDGSERWLYDRGRVFRDAAGRPQYMTGACVDITERKRAEEELRARADEIEAMLDATPAAIWIARDPGCERITGSRAAHELLRTRAGANLSKTAPDAGPVAHFRVLHDGAPVPDAELPLQKAAREGVEVRDYEEEIAFDDGTAVFLYGTAVPLFDAEGRPRGAIGAFTDVSRLKRAERALREADRRKDEFLAMLAHELRNPLAPIRNAVDLLAAAGAGGERVERARQVIARQVAHLGRMVDDLLDVSRVTRGTIQLRREAADAAAVVAAAAETIRPHLDARRQTLRVAAPASPLPLHADVARLTQVFTNLLHNASKYSADGQEIAALLERDGEHALVRVVDGGRGIPPAMLEAVFQLFTQVDPGVDGTQGGLGIGLTLVRALVALHGGDVTAHSAGPGRGSEFLVRLPLAPAARRDVPREDGAAPSPPRRVLVVDDNRDAADTLGDLLAALGHEVRVAYDAPRALELISERAADVVLLDLGLPAMDGYEAARRVRALQPDVRLVALTGYGQPSDRQRAQDAGFDHHLVKPADPEAIARLVSGAQ